MLVLLLRRWGASVWWALLYWLHPYFLSLFWLGYIDAPVGFFVLLGRFSSPCGRRGRLPLSPGSRSGSR